MTIFYIQNKENSQFYIAEIQLCQGPYALKKVRCLIPALFNTASRVYNSQRLMQSTAMLQALFIRQSATILPGRISSTHHQSHTTSPSACSTHLNEFLLPTRLKSCSALQVLSQGRVLSCYSRKISLFPNEKEFSLSLAFRYRWKDRLPDLATLLCEI